MNPNDTISISLLLSSGSFIIALIGCILSIRKQSKDETILRKTEIEAENQRQLKLAENFNKVNLKLDMFCDNLTQINLKSEKANTDIGKIHDEVLRIGYKAEDLEKRLTALEKRSE